MNTKNFKTLFVLSLLMLVLTACTGKSAALEGTSWQLVDFAGKPLVPGHNPTMSFQEGRIGGNSSCNTYGGDYTLKGEKIEFGMMMSTMMACAENDAMTQEQEYLALLGEVESWALQDGQLFLHSAAGDTLVFNALH